MVFSTAIQMFPDMLACRSRINMHNITSSGCEERVGEELKSRVTWLDPRMNVRVHEQGVRVSWGMVVGVRGRAQARQASESLGERAGAGKRARGSRQAQDV
ncbi:hypothetical protein CRG98_009936 [Punica granatum]|uniref:Uncharacterized protein n=1 Tax=Punica granatum TaxID=22663 RepID=A0A2I0KME1_PUNGR|nr:hypothetical protein CRG98_009936 [Punica granatum]